MKSRALIVAGCACLLIAGCKPKTDMGGSTDSSAAKPAMAAAGVNTELNKKNAQRFYDEVMNQKKMDLMDSLCAPGYVEHNPPPGAEPTIAGLKKAMTGWVKTMPDLHCTVEDMMTDGDKVIARISMTGTWKEPMEGMPMKPTGKSFKISGIDIMKFDSNGKCTEHWGNEDDMKMMMDIGMMPSMDPAAAGGDKAKKM